MKWNRAKDWLIGAVAMVLVLVVVVVILWWVVSDPADGGAAGPVPSATGSSRPRAPEAPAGLRGDEVWFADLELDGGTVVAAGSLLRNVRAVGQDVVMSPDRVVAARLAVDATVPFEVVAGELGDGTVVGPADDGQAMVVRTVEVLGRELRVTAIGTVEVAAGKLVVEPRSIDFGGPGFFSDSIAAVVRGLVKIEHDIEGLPEGLVLQDVTVQDDGFRADLRGEHVKLTP